MKSYSLIKTPFGPLFEKPNLVEQVLSNLNGKDLKEIYIQPSVLVPGDDCCDHRVNGILYVAITRSEERFQNAFVAQGVLARSLIDFFGKKRVRNAISEIKSHFEKKGVPVIIQERIYK